MRKKRKRKLDTPEEIEKVCELHYLTSSTMEQIGNHFGVSQGVPRRVIAEHGKAYAAKHQKEIDEFRKQYHGW